MRCPECEVEYVDAAFHARTHAAASEWLDRVDEDARSQTDRRPDRPPA